MWSSASGRQMNYGVPPEMGMFVVAPATHHVSDQPHAHSLHPTAATTTTSAAAATAIGVGVIPLLTATPCFTVEDGGFVNRRVSNIASGSNSIQFWQTPQSYSKKPMFSDHVYGGGGSSGGGAATTCQDCGNQAKKDCSHRRCRTCCKGRGFDCATHVKSTWVPAARRRERQLLTSTGGAAAGSSASTSGSKKPRLTSRTTSNASTSNTTPPRSFATSSSHYHQDASFMRSLPAQVRAPAVFKCVRVTAVEDGDAEYAYQASVKISGHVFKGFLYDQGLETRDHQTNIHNLSELHLGGGGGRNVGCSLASPPHNPPDVYGSSGGGLLG